MTRMRTDRNRSKGVILPGILVFAAISVMLITAVVGGANAVVRQSRTVHIREQAFQVAEAGIEYYRWHLAHDKDDYQDGTGAPGPYVHDFFDKYGNLVGTYTLSITPPLPGSTLVTILSEGRVDGYPSIVRKIRVRLAIPSLAQYAVATNDDLWIPQGTEVYGPIHSNYGVRFDGVAHNIVTSALDEYHDPSHAGNEEYGVHTHVVPPPGAGVDGGYIVAESPLSPLQDRPDVFIAGRAFPVPPIDFSGITADLATMKTDAQAGGEYVAPSGAQGYHIVLKTDDTFDLYRVTSLVPVPNGCVDVQGQQGWGSWSINAGGETLLGNYPLPGNGIIFVEDHVWVSGQIDTARVTIAAGEFPDNSAKRKDIIVNNDVTYTNYDGRDVIALVAQGNVSVGLVSEDDLRIDAALVAQNGRVGRNYFRPPSGNQNRCAPYHVRSLLTLYGALGSNEQYLFNYPDGTGYTVRLIMYDGNILFGPPPSFPLTTDQYQVISWEEVR